MHCWLRDVPSFGSAGYMPSVGSSTRQQPLSLARSPSEEDESEDDDEESLPPAPGPRSAAPPVDDDLIEIISSDEDEEESSVQRPGDRARPSHSDEDAEEEEEQEGSYDDEEEDVDELRSSPVRPAVSSRRQSSPAWSGSGDRDDEEDEPAVPTFNGQPLDAEYDSLDDEEAPAGPEFSPQPTSVSPQLAQADDEEPWQGIGGDVEMDGIDQFGAEAEPMPTLDPALFGDAGQFPMSVLADIAASALLTQDQPDVPVMAQPDPPSPAQSDGSLEYVENPFSIVAQPHVPVPSISSVPLPATAAPLVPPAGFDDYDEEAAAQLPPNQLAEPVAVEEPEPTVAEDEPGPTPAPTLPSTAQLQPEPRTSSPRKGISPTMVDRLRRVMDAEAKAALFGEDEPSTSDDEREGANIEEMPDDDDGDVRHDDRTEAQKAEDAADRDQERYFDEEEANEVATQSQGSSIRCDHVSRTQTSSKTPSMRPCRVPTARCLVQQSK